MAVTLEQIIAWFPKLQDDPLFRLTSPTDYNYNCIAWAMGLNDRWCWPWSTYGNPVFWPSEPTDDLPLEAFVKLFETIGYEICLSEEVENCLTKVALFVDDTNSVSHAARQLPDGTWTSKLGPLNDIRHSLHALEGDIYGNVHCIMQRKK